MRQTFKNGTKQLKESKTDKQKRVANNRMAQNQARKFVIPGIFAVFAFLFLIMVAKYGLRGTKRGIRVSKRPALDNMWLDLREGHYRPPSRRASPGLADPNAEARAYETYLMRLVQEAMAKGDRKLAADHIFRPARSFPFFHQDYNSVEQQQQQQQQQEEGDQQQDLVVTLDEEETEEIVIAGDADEDTVVAAADVAAKEPESHLMENPAAEAPPAENKVVEMAMDHAPEPVAAAAAAADVGQAVPEKVDQVVVEAEADPMA